MLRLFICLCICDHIIEVFEHDILLYRVSMPTEKSRIFSLKFPGPGKSWKIKFKVLESPGIY